MNTRNFMLCVFAICLGTLAWADGTISLVEFSSAHDYNCHIVYANSTATLELGLFNPVNPSFGDIGERAVTHVKGFECKLIPQEGVTILAVHFPVPAIDAGSNGGMAVGYSEPIPVVEGGKTVLATVDVYFGGETSFTLQEEPYLRCDLEFNTWIQITETYPASIAGSLAFLDADDPDDELVAASCNEGADFMFNLLQDPAVPTETGPWGSLKSLYR